MGAPRATALANGQEQPGVYPRHFEVVSQYRQAGHNVLEEGSPRLPSLSGGDLNPDAELGNRDCGDRRVVVIGDQAVEVERRTLRDDQDVGVE